MPPIHFVVLRFPHIRIVTVSAIVACAHRKWSYSDVVNSQSRMGVTWLKNVIFIMSKQCEQKK